MNWLAHVFLSEPNVEFRLGNLLADVVRGAQRETLGDAFLRGARQHHAIDSFTDAHPVVRRSRARIGASQRRFSGVIVDVFYDYLLATRWPDYSTLALDEFTAQFYDQVRGAGILLPEPAQTLVERIARHDLLGSYARAEGVERSLRRISMHLASRWNRPFALEQAVADLVAHEAAFAADFAEFFPALQAHVEGRD